MRKEEERERPSTDLRVRFWGEERGEFGGEKWGEMLGLEGEKGT